MAASLSEHDRELLAEAARLQAYDWLKSDEDSCRADADELLRIAALLDASTERPRVRVRGGVPADVQENEMQNATLQTVADGVVASVATYVDLGSVDLESVGGSTPDEVVADHLRGLLEQVAGRHPEMTFEVLVGRDGTAT